MSSSFDRINSKVYIYYYLFFPFYVDCTTESFCATVIIKVCSASVALQKADFMYGDNNENSSSWSLNFYLLRTFFHTPPCGIPGSNETVQQRRSPFTTRGAAPFAVAHVQTFFFLFSGEGRVWCTLP